MIRLLLGTIVGVAAWLVSAPPAVAPRALGPSTPAFEPGLAGTLLRPDLPVRRQRRPPFPVAGRHRIGREAAQRFGGARGHLGQDVFARCGTPVVAVTGGRVRRATYEGAAGNYAVVTAPDRRAYVYMHLRRPARVREGDRVRTGERLGAVGRTGDADGCHLHFELWTAPGWFRGHAVDPYRRLRALERR